MNLPNPWMTLLPLWALIAVLMAAGWLWQRKHDNAGIVDVIWAGSVGASAVHMGVMGDGDAPARVLLGLMGGVWGLRLASHLWHRVRHEDEDGRYRYLRDHWHGSQLRFFAFFQAQALLVVLFSLPFLAASRTPHASPWQLGAAALVWLASVLGEGLADRQLARFRADASKRGQTCRDGLWRYSRHPNYFFEWLHWFSYVVLAIGSPIAWLAWVGPVLMYLFLRYLSGVPFTEQQALRTRGDDYRDYQRTTPMLFPWFPKKSDRSPT